jgi:hypothetical protein
LREASEIAVAYAGGQITPEEANERFLSHSGRWRDVFHGGLVIPPGGLTDAAIYQSLDKERGIGEFSGRVAQQREQVEKKRKVPEH